jgi:RimJ/RimL family protein N-acetyltransferase
MNDTAPRFVAIGDPRPADVAWPTMSWPPLAETRLTGQLVELAPCVPNRDAEPLFRALDHDAVWQHLFDRPLDASAYAQSLGRATAEGRLPWIVRLRAPHATMPAGAVVGTSSYLDVSSHDARLEIGSTAYHPALWATKVNPEAKLLLLTYAFETLHAGRVQLKTDVRNVRSQQAIARLGARYEGTLRRYQRRDDGTMRDTVMFSIIAEDWPAVRERLLARLKEPETGR